MKRKTAALLALCLLLSLTACGAGSPAMSVDAPSGDRSAEQTPSAETETEPEPLSPVNGMTVALVPAGTGSMYEASARETAEQFAAQWGLTLLVMDGADREAAVRRAIGAGVNGLCVAAADESLLGALREASAADIPVTVWDSETLPGLRALRVSRGTAEQLGNLLVEMGVSSLAARGAAAGEGEVKYIWFCGESADENAWCAAGRSAVRERYPNWLELDAPQSIGTDGEAASAAAALLDEYPYADLILCTGEDALRAMCKAARDKELDAGTLSVTGICPPAAASECLQSGVCVRCGYWDGGLESAAACYLAAWLAAGNAVHVGDIVNVPRIGSMELLPNEVLAQEQNTGAENDGVVLLPERMVLTAENAADYSD